MSVTTFGDLLTQAEQVLIALAGQRGPDPLGLAAAWLDFSRRAVHAITAAAGARDPRWYAVDRLIVEVTRPMGRAIVARPAPRLPRIHCSRGPVSYWGRRATCSPPRRGTRWRIRCCSTRM